MLLAQVRKVSKSNDNQILPCTIENIGITCFKNSALQLISRIITLIRFLRTGGINQYNFFSLKVIHNNLLCHHIYNSLLLLLHINNPINGTISSRDIVTRRNGIPVTIRTIYEYDKRVLDVNCGQDDAGNYIASFLRQLMPSEFEQDGESIIIPDNMKDKKCRRLIESDNGRYLFKSGDPRYTYQLMIKTSLYSEEGEFIFQYDKHEILLIITPGNCKITDNKGILSLNLSDIVYDIRGGFTKWENSMLTKVEHTHFSHYAIISIGGDNSSDRYEKITLCSYDHQRFEYNIRLRHFSGKMLLYKLVCVLLRSGTMGSGGHYKAFCNYNDIWYEYNDSYRYTVRPDEIMSLYTTGKSGHFIASVVLYECIEDNYDVNDHLNYSNYLKDYIICNQEEP